MQSSLPGCRFMFKSQMVKWGSPYSRSRSGTAPWTESTPTRMALISVKLTSSIIRAALGLTPNTDLPAHPLLNSRAPASRPSRLRLKHSVILEAEVVPYNESSREGGRGPGVEEFWHLGAAGVTPDTTDEDQGWKNRNRHLCLVFFDVLHLDGTSLLDTSYEGRRRCLEKVVKVIPGFVSHTWQSALMGSHISSSGSVSRCGRV